MNPLICTFTGKNVNPLHLQPEDIDIHDIAHALSCCNRFAGHALKPISVAQHSVYVSRLCEPNRAEALQALFHDASEAYLGDVTKWLKGSPEFEAYRKAESRVQNQIFRKFGCATKLTPNVEAADKLMLRFEGEKAFGLKRWTEWSAIIKYPLAAKAEKEMIGAWDFISWRQAEEMFLTQFRLLNTP